VKSQLLSRLPLILFASLLALPFWLSETARPPSSSRNEGTHLPDYMIEDFSIIRMSDDGLARHQLFAKSMKHFPDDNSITMENPRFVDIGSSKPAMQVNADHAKMSGKGEDVYLTGNVMVLRNGGKGRGETTMTTSLLHLIPEKDIAKTDKPVVITEKNAVINAVGMEMNNRTQTTQLLSQVKVVQKQGR
jgi:lipopolysaccharide export system protein LptC